MKKAGVLLVCMTFSFFLMIKTAAAQGTVPLGAAATFAIVAGSGITNTGPTTITGNVGSFPTTTQTGFGSVTLSGTNHGGDAVTQGAKTDLGLAYLNAQGRSVDHLISADLGGQTLLPGVYKDNGAPASLGLTGTLRLDGQGDPNSVFIFQSASTLITAVGSSVVLMNGAQACNIFWQVGSSATLNTTTAFVGTILASASITVQSGVTVAGRLLAGASGAGALILNTNTIAVPVCAGPPPAMADLTITKIHSGNFVQGQVGAAYTITASNVGTASTAGMVTVSDTMPAGLTATGVSGSGWSCTLSTLTCTRSNALPAGASYSPITVTVNVAGGAPATLINTTTVSGGGESNLGNNSATDTTTITPLGTPDPDLIITKSSDGDFQQGGRGSYTLTVRNIGSAPTSGTVTVVDTLPEGLTPAAISGSGWSCTLSTLTCTRDDALAPGATYPPVTVTVNVADDPLICSQAGNVIGFQPGDILLSMHDGTVQWRRHDWTLVKIITSVTDGQAKGMAFDTSRSLFVTHFFANNLSTGNNVEKFDRTGNVTGSFGSSFDCNPSAIIFDETGNAFIGHSDCGGDIFKVDSEGNRLARYDVAVENRGSSHLLLDPDQCTMYYTSQGRNVKRFNVCTNTQMPDFNRAPLPDVIGGAHQLARLPGGGLLVANFSVIARLDVDGNLIRTYDAPDAAHCWLGLALDPDGTSFWATNWCDSSATRIDMMSRDVIETHVASDLGYMLKQIILVPPLPGLCSEVVTNTAAVSGGGEVNIGNNSASSSTTITSQPQTPVLSVDSTAYCVGMAWNLGVSDAPPNATVRLIGTTDGQPWVMREWATTDNGGSCHQGGTFADKTQGNYKLRVEIDGKISNIISLVVSNCGR